MPGPALLVNDVITFRVWSAVAEQAAVNTFHYQVVGVTGAGADLSDAAGAFDSLIASSYKLLLQNNAQYRGVQAYVNHLPLPQAQISIVNAGAGTGGTVGQSRQTCGLSKWLTDFAGPAYRGRTYWPFPPTADDSGIGVPSAPYVVDLQTITVLMFLFFTIPGTVSGSVSIRMVLKHGENKAGVTPAPTPITSLFVDPAWATQKRRGSFGRANSSPI